MAWRARLVFVLAAACAAASRAEVVDTPSPTPPTAARIPEGLRGRWMNVEREADLSFLLIEDTTAAVRFRRQQFPCEMTSQAGRLPPKVASATFRCPTPTGPLLLGVTRPGERLLLVHAVAPDEPEMRWSMLIQPTAASHPPPPPPPPDAIPQFPWPAPRCTLRTVLPPSLGVAVAGEPLGLAFDRLREALRRAQISEWSVYGIDADGFALVARMERIDDSGRPAAERWAESPRRAPFSVGDYLKALFAARPGRYRVIALLVTARAVIPDTAPTSRDAIERLWRGGAGDLPESVRKVPLPASGRAEALVYEFFRPSEDDPPQEVVTSALTGPQHLSGAGLWPIEELTR